jgi:Domain of Unknown Function (DUF1080)/Concanavalin A-like lectin/glucanases superfamily
MNNTARCYCSLLLFVLTAAQASSVWARPQQAEATSAGFVPLIIDQDLANWKGAVDDYQVIDGAIMCKPGRGGVLYTAKQYADFVIKLEFQLPAGGNNGLAIRYPGYGRAAYDGMCELQVLDDDAPQYATLDPRQYHGSIYGIVAAQRGALKPAGQWNEQVVTVTGSRIKVELNGTVIVDADVAKVDSYLEDKPHPGKMLSQGHFGFAGHGDPVKFRNLFIKEVKPAQQPDPASLQEQIQKHLTFLVSFDQGFEADFASGDNQPFTALDLNRTKTAAGTNVPGLTLARGLGRFGNAVQFAEKSDISLCYPAAKIGYQTENWSGTASFWMKLNPDKDLQPGYCDPLLISDKQWDNAAFFVDFDKDLPRDFRLGVFPDFEVWNSQKTPWEKIAVADRPMIVVKQPPFAADQWTHVCFTWHNANHPNNLPGTARLYLNGKWQGSRDQNLRYTWNPEKAAIMLGIYYIGLMDEVALFNRALTDDEIKYLYQLPTGLTPLAPAK